MLCLKRYTAEDVLRLTFWSTGQEVPYSHRHQIPRQPPHSVCAPPVRGRVEGEGRGRVEGEGGEVGGEEEKGGGWFKSLKDGGTCESVSALPLV